MTKPDTLASLPKKWRQKAKDLGDCAEGSNECVQQFMYLKHAAEVEAALDALVEKLERKAIASREEADRIRRTVNVVTDAETNCYVRAEVWDQVVAELRRRGASDVMQSRQADAKEANPSE